ncbi:hypothetical protein LEP1GSC041_2568 [Leptospira noguchii str. 2006001870]|uniref:Uncharacterized protein n=1 Tax=Leptospira noguchii serovar Autumnalis str. ZUN142 TaxID=1085540 RepID=M6U2Z3_9LEPT|nr:hypothetical protein LEP1GSC041_2568 [Leptospira noguchii str. 2006001870]EMO25280.1 hypothetical protein LEP1GSC170_3276 [Leptospira interrogans serovar Bataviae str. HAI135]EMO39407.1 hypothetical protein LEP1GSC186_1164 [Leptospira noguchii serovar Autumnalis str. ZUN142]
METATILEFARKTLICNSSHKLSRFEMIFILSHLFKVILV